MEKTKFKITSPEGEVHLVDVLSKWLNEHNLKEHGFRKVLRGVQSSCYGGWKIEKQDTINNSLLNLAQQNTRNVTLINVIRRENCHKVEFSNKKGDTLTRKLNISKVNCLSGERCSLSGDNILLGELVGKCRDPQGEVYNFSIKHLTKLGYSFDLDFSTPRVVEKTVKVVEERFSPELLENKLHEQMETVIKEIKKTQDRLSQLKNTKDEIGRNLSSIIKANEFVGKVDKLLGEK